MKAIKIALPYEYDWKVNQTTVNFSKHDISFHYNPEAEIFCKALILKKRKYVLDFKIKTNFLFDIWFEEAEIHSSTIDELINYVIEIFDLNYDLDGFYKMADHDEILSPLVQKFRGLRFFSLLNLYESFLWTIISQQINLNFAYAIKKELVQKHGIKIAFQGLNLYVFPEIEKVASLSEQQLKELKLSKNKIRTIQLVTKMFQEKVFLDWKSQNSKTIQKQLLKIKGIGVWSANYIMLKSLKVNDFMLYNDAGLHNCLKKVLNLESVSKQTLENLERKYQNYCRYAVLYLWKVLY